MKDQFSVAGLRNSGFQGFIRARDAYLDLCAFLPPGPGVYVVLRTTTAAPKFLDTSKGGHFKGKDPTVDAAVLEGRLIAATPVLYIGKADALQQRVRQLLDFANGKPVGHYGGRYLWQIGDSDDYLIAWRTDSKPRVAETELLEAFFAEFGALPYANLVR